MSGGPLPGRPSAPPPLWTPEEDAIIVQNRLRDAIRLLPARTAHAVGRRRCVLVQRGVMEPAFRAVRYRGNEDAVLRAASGVEVAGRVLAHRSFEGLRSRRFVLLGKRHPAGRPWGADEIAQIEAGATRLPGRTATAFQRKRDKLGLTAPAPPSWTAAEVAELRETGRCRSRSPNACSTMRRKLGISLRPLIDAPAIHERVSAVVSRALPRQVRDEVVQDLCVRVMERTLALSDLGASAVKAAISAVYKRHPQLGAPLSLDMPVFQDGATTLGDRIASDAFHF